ncbi:MAG: ATP-dependent RNA helicase dbp10 [Bathelium mastoideum]|nr:MAG: ATP-dependent RNA helicase dbp10 [Bathelium mastoideum]
MRTRNASPVASENDFDISNALAETQLTRPHGQDDLAKDHENGGDAEGDTEDETFIAAHQAASNRKSSGLKGRTVKKGGGFQAMGLNAVLLKAITRKGFSVPTPIQRRTIPLLLDGQDVVGMARTGSGKTAAFVIPLIAALKSHSAKVGARALILSPSRELALQTLKVVKDLGRGTDLRTILVVGGESLEDQFASMATNPDVIIAAPGRFLHLQTEMGLDLSSIRFVVFDEADRLFEMGFASQLTEILHALPSSRQTSLFSATLPKSLVEFAKAGLQEPTLVRLDAESKISPDLQSVFFTLKSAEKEGALLHILQDVIELPLGRPENPSSISNGSVTESKKRKRTPEELNSTEQTSGKSTIIFTATKHHVEYLSTMLQSVGFGVSFIYGTLDQSARKQQIQDFRTGHTTILVVTDVAARGVDIPLLANVINYDFPSKPKLFVHRVGRTARAGRRGWSFNFVTDTDLPYLIDLQLFLGRRLCLGRTTEHDPCFTRDIVIGGFDRSHLEHGVELATKLLENDDDLAILRDVSTKGERRYLATRNWASSESRKRAKNILTSHDYSEPHIFFGDQDPLQVERQRMLSRVSSFRPQESVFDIGKHGATSAGTQMMQRRKQHSRVPEIRLDDTGAVSQCARKPETTPADGEHESSKTSQRDSVESDLDEATEDPVEITFAGSGKIKHNREPGIWQDSEHFMSYTPQLANLAEDRGYRVSSGAGSDPTEAAPTFLDAARTATMDLTNDESKGFAEPSKAKGMRWDKKAKKYVARENDHDGSKGTKFIRGESGQRIAASFRSGRFDAWRRANKIERLPRTGETESVSHRGEIGRPGGKRYRHKAEQAPKEADKFRDNFYIQKRRVEEAKDRRIGRFKQSPGTNLRGIDDVRKQRRLKDKRRQKNARPSRKRSG